MSSYIELWDAREVLDLISKGALIIDVRLETAYAKEHIPGAINIPLKNLEERIEELPRDKPIIVYCTNVDCETSHMAALKLASLGFKNIYRFRPGVKGWEAQGQPVEKSL
ncbi:MAG: rhodanese-like domain-containing protein [Acidilobaceae archaeon]